MAQEFPEKPGQFQATRWSIVLAARKRQTPEGDAALGWLCERYWLPLKTWAQAKGLPPTEAEDLVQGFFAQALQVGLVASADSSRGRFRSFLLGCLEHYWADLRRRTVAQKRGGGAAHSSDETLLSGIPGGRTPEQEYDRAWAYAVLERATSRLEAECDADGHSGRFAMLRVFLEGERGELPLATAATTLGLSLPAVKSIVYRLRQRMGELVREEVRETVQHETDTELELRELFHALRS